MIESVERTQKIREAVRQAYSEAAERPKGEHPFPVGRCFAESVGYPEDLLSALPSVSVDSFSGVSNVSLFADIPVGATVLDLGCGAGLDSLIAAGRVGKTGRVISIDFSEAMIARACEAAIEAQINNIEFKQADAENLPIPNESIDVALLNGIFNLNPMREAIFRELGRVIRSGGAVYAAELILKNPLPSEFLNEDSDWFAWIAGAKEGGAFLNEFHSAGFCEVRLLRTMQNARTENPHVLAAEVYARKKEEDGWTR